MSKFLGFFRKKSNKENEQPASQDVLYRNHSVRGSRRGERSLRYEDQEEHLLPSSINPYHSVGKPRIKGPRSCPGGYKEEQFRYEDYEREASKSRTKADRFRRSVRDTSEYGSGDPSPIGHNGRHSNYNASVMYDSEEDEDDFQHETERRLQEKLKYSETRRYAYKEKYLKVKQEKEQCEGAFHDRIKTLNKENIALKDENNRMRHELRIMQAQLQQVSRQPPMSHMFNAQCAPSGFTPSASFGYPLSTPQRPFGIQPMMTNGSMITPGTSTAMDTSVSGAGEALSQPNDLSFQPNSIHFTSSASFDSRQMDDMDVKTFHTEEDDDNGLFNGQVEMGRGGVSSSSMGIRPEQTVTLVKKAVDSTASSSTVVCDGDLSTAEHSPAVRRTASDGALN